jgi:hypothetical protein
MSQELPLGTGTLRPLGPQSERTAEMLGASAALPTDGLPRQARLSIRIFLYICFIAVRMPKSNGGGMISTSLALPIELLHDTDAYRLPPGLGTSRTGGGCRL